MRLSIRFNLYAGALHTPSVIYPAIVVALIDREQMIIAPLTATIVLFALFKLYDAYNSYDSTPRIFSGLFAISTLTMIYPVTLPLLLILLVTMVILDRDMHDMLVGTLSILMPFGIALYICWLCEIPIDSVTEEYFEAITAPHYRLCEMLPQVIYITLTALISLYGLLQLDSISIALVSRTRITFAAVLAILGVGLFAIPALSTVEYITMAAPASIAISAALLAMKQRWATILYLIFILAGTALAIIRMF